MTDIVDIEFELQQLAELIAHARARLKGKNPINVTDFPARTEAVCSRISQLPREDSIKFDKRMTMIISDLDKLADEISAQQQSLKELLESLEGASDG